MNKPRIKETSGCAPFSDAMAYQSRQNLVSVIDCAKFGLEGDVKMALSYLEDRRLPIGTEVAVKATGIDGNGDWSKLGNGIAREIYDYHGNLFLSLVPEGKSKVKDDMEVDFQSQDVETMLELHKYVTETVSRMYDEYMKTKKED